MSKSYVRSMPISENTFKQHAKRLLAELENFTQSRPDGINLSTAQEILSRVWKHEDYRAALKALRQNNENDRDAQTEYGTAATVPIFQTLGPTRSEDLLLALLDKGGAAAPGNEYWTCRAEKLAETVVMCAFSGRGASVKMGAVQDDYEFPVGLSISAVREWMALAPMLALLKSNCLGSKDQRILHDFLQSVTAGTNDLENALTHGDFQGSESSKLQFGFVSMQFNRILENLSVLEKQDIVLFDKEWETSLWLERMRAGWNLYNESWLISQDDKYCGSWFMERLNPSTNQFSARDALEIISYGSHSKMGKLTLPWMHKAKLLSEMAADLQRYMNEVRMNC